MKQMILKYFYRSFGILLWILMLTSCINSTTIDHEPSKDAQIYSFSMTSATDSNKYLNEAKFSIDQINGKIFNKDSLRYLFDVDSVLLSISGGRSIGFSGIEIKLRDADSVFMWNGEDSIALHRLKSIETTAEDGKTKMKYDVSVNIHQQDPYIFSWDNISGDYINTSSVESQKTISFKNQFITYYKVGNDVRSSVASASKGDDWSSKTVSGLSESADISTVIPATQTGEPILYMLDNDGKAYASSDGLSWVERNSAYPIRAIFGELPFITGEYSILVSLEHEGSQKFATTDDLLSFDVLNEIKGDMPVSGFSAVSINNPKVYSAKYIVLSGGRDVDGVPNNKIWIITEKDGKINSISESISAKIKGSKLFLYDNKIYMIVSEAEEEEDVNKFYYSENYGLSWTWGGDSQSVDEGMSFRTNSSVISDSDNYIWIFGGESRTDVQIVDVWRGRLNKLAK